MVSVDVASSSSGKSDGVQPQSVPLAPRFQIIFCRYRKSARTGQVLDAHDYGLRNWRIITPK